MVHDRTMARDTDRKMIDLNFLATKKELDRDRARRSTREQAVDRQNH